MKHEQPRTTIPAYFGSLVSQTIAQPIQWLWQDRIPQSRLTLLEGESGIGKSLLALHIAACVSNAQPLPGTTVPTKGGVIIIAPGINDNDTIKPRLQAAGADLSRILLLSLPPRFTPAHSIASDLEYIEVAIKDIGASLVIIDPLAPFLTRATRASRSDNFDYLVHLAQRTHCAFLLLRTISKPHPSSLNSTGPLDLLDVLSNRLLILPDPQQPQQYLLTCTKHTLCAQPPTLAYRLTSQDHTVPAIDWLGESTYPNVLALSQPSTQRQRILTLLQESLTALSPNDLTQQTEQTHDSTCKLLQRMLRSGLLVSSARGLYTLPNHPCLATAPNTTKSDSTVHTSVHIVHTPISDSLPTLPHPPIQMPIPDSLSDISHPPVHTVHSVQTAYKPNSSHLIPVPTASSDPIAPPPVHSVHIVHTPISDSLPTLPHLPVQMPIPDSLSDISHPPVHSVHLVHPPISNSLPAPLHTPIPIHTLGIWLSEIEAAIPIQEPAT